MTKITKQNDTFPTKRFGPVVANDDISLVVEPGQIHALLGENGAGKSTLMNTIAGLEEVTTGQLLLAGEDVTERSPKDRDIAMVFQNYALFPHMSVA